MDVLLQNLISGINLWVSSSKVLAQPTVNTVLLLLSLLLQDVNLFPEPQSKIRPYCSKKYCKANNIDRTFIY